MVGIIAFARRNMVQTNPRYFTEVKPIRSEWMTF